ncbi:MAG: nucleotide sugar dehydrogenase [Candidatus Hodarchaeota archaeon]
MNLMNYPEEKIKIAMKNGQIKLAVIGLGRIGLPTAAIFAESGVNVIGIEINPKLVELLNQGKNYIDEPGLDELIERNIKSKKLKISKDLNLALANSEIIIIAVSIPITKDNKPDYSIIKKVTENISKILKIGQLIIVESTISPGTVEELIIPILEEGSKLKCGRDFLIASCPERANPGNIINTLKNSPRIIGGMTKKSTDLTAAIYSSIVDAEIIKTTNPKTANAVKLTENIFRDVNIALMNELAILYERLNIDIYEIINCASTKWNFIPHYPGPGVGGPCIPANPYYLIQEATKMGYIPYLIRISREINDRMPDHMIQLIQKSLNFGGKSVKNSLICILGISYKPEIKDFQLSPSIPIIKKLKNLQAKLKIFDPYYINEIVLDYTIEETLESAVKDSDCLVIVTNHKIFQNMNLKKIQKLSKSPLIIVDGRNTIKLENLPKNSIYQCIGRPIFIF